MKYTYKKERRDPQIQSYMTDKGKRWRIRFTITIRGKRHQVERQGIASFDMARSIKQSIISDLESETGYTTLTVEEYFEQYCEEKLNNGSWRYSTYARSKSMFKKRFYPDWGDTLMIDVRRGDYQRWITKLIKDKNYAHNTASTFSHIVSSVFADALVNDDIPKNPIQKIKISGTKPRDTSMTRLEFEKVFNYIKLSPSLSTQERAMAMLATLGLRHEEIDGIKLKYVKDNMIGVFEVLNLHGEVTEPKTHSSKRWVPMTPLVEEYVNQAIKETKKVYAKKGRIMSPDDFIFVSHWGNHVRYTQLTQVFQRISQDTGIHVWPHKLRHAFSTIAFGIEGINPRDIANILGHSKLDMSMFYNNGTDEGKQNVITKIGNMF